MNELDRIRCLPERDWHDRIDMLVDYMTEHLRTPNGSWRLHEHQAAALADILEYGGAVLPHPVGSGKSLIGFLAGPVTGAKRPLVLVPAKLRQKTVDEARDVYAEHWRIPEFNLQSYETLSRDWENSYLTTTKADLIFADECHALANTKSACWKKLKAYVKNARKSGYPVRVVFASGTLMNRALSEYAHLLRMALGPLAPIPEHWQDLRDMSDALRSKLPWGRERPDPEQYHCLGENDPDEDPVTRAQQAYGDRLKRTPGIVFLAEERPSYALEVDPVWVDLPSTLDEHFTTLRKEWLTPDEYPLEYPMQVWAHARQLATGFYYRPNPRPPQSWLNARRDWNLYRTDMMKRFSQRYHSPGQLADAIRKGDHPDPGGYLAMWERAKEEFKYQQEAVWLDDTVLLEAANWLAAHRGICWIEHIEPALRLGEMTGLPVYGEGAVCTKTGAPVAKAKGPIIATQACATGQNLQHHHHKNLIVTTTPTGKMQEQLLGRTHRFGQKKDLVTAEYVFACKEQFSGFWSAVRDSWSARNTGFTPWAKLTVATLSIPTTPEAYVDFTSAAWL